jgi:hypothetical protein
MAKKNAAFAILGFLLMIGTLVVLLPGIHGTSPGSSSTPEVVTRTGATTTYAQGHETITYSLACSGTSETFGNMILSLRPCVAYGFPSAFVRNATLDTRQVLPFIKTAYECHLVYFAHGVATSDVMYVVLNVTGSQVVNGNCRQGIRSPTWGTSS